MDRDLLDRVRSESWPPPTSTGAGVRACARRRGRLRASLAGVGATVLIVVVAVTVNAAYTPERDVEVVDQRGREASTNFADVSFTLPQGWTIKAGKDFTEGHQACLGPSDSLTTDCPVLITVTDTPANPMLNVIPTLTQDCEPTDPRHVTANEITISGRQADHYVAQCTATSPRIHGWALANRAMHLTTSGQVWVAAAQSIFKTVTVPEDWPEPDNLTESEPTAEPEAGT